MIPTEDMTMGKKQPQNVAYILVGITALVWLLVYVAAKRIARDSRLALVPLYGLYPGQAASSHEGSAAMLMHAWAVAVAVVFLTLASVGVIRKSKMAAIWLILLFMISTLVGLLRIFSVINSIH